MTKVPKYWNTAKKYLSKKDKVMSNLIKNYHDPSEIILTSRRDIFFSLCKSIIGQQISVAAANSVFLKFKKRCKNKITAKVVNRLSYANLKRLKDLTGWTPQTSIESGIEKTIALLQLQ